MIRTETDMLKQLIKTIKDVVLFAANDAEIGKEVKKIIMDSLKKGRI